MSVEALLAPFFSKLISAVVDGGVEALKKNSDAKHLRRMVRERLMRELRLNDELLKYEKLTDGERVSSIETEALEFIMSQPIPLSAFFEVMSPIDRTVFMGPSNDKHTSWVMSIQSEGDLVERWWHRVRLAQIKQKLGLPPGDLEYLQLLCRALHASLRKAD